MCHNARTCLAMDKHLQFSPEYKFWIKYHPKGVVHLIVNHNFDAACACCYTLENLTVDHIVPKAKLGNSEPSNKQILCSFCNTIKADEIIEMKDLRNLVKEKLAQTKVNV